jgi:phosphoglycolate phosphatase-like HAD superfamily hydrolase
MTTSDYSRQDLIGLQPRHDAFVGIDSDGCVFETMDLKQKQCFHPRILSQWGLQSIEKYVREAAEFVNLYSKWRGTNRFPALVRTLDLLRERKEVRESGIPIPALSALRRFIDSGAPLGNAELERAAADTGDPELLAVLKWSQDVNADIARTVKNVPPYPWVRECFEKMKQHSDILCVSQTPTEALVREWAENGLTGYVVAIAGQELGTKAEHLAMAAGGKYPPDRVLMIGDAPGDRKAAAANRALFYPINPGKESASWERLHREAFDRFLAGSYAGEYEKKVIAEFDALLPERAPWQ